MISAASCRSEFEIVEVFLTCSLRVVAHERCVVSPSSRVEWEIL